MGDTWKESFQCHCKSLAKTYQYWLFPSSLQFACVICEDFPVPVHSDVPTKPWCSLMLDNFEYKGSLYLIIYDRFTRFIVVKKCADLSAHSAILSLLEVFVQIGAETLCQKNLQRFWNFSKLFLRLPSFCKPS